MARTRRPRGTTGTPAQGTLAIFTPSGSESSEPSRNDFCRATDLSNEASVESFFVLRLLKALGYQDGEIHTKKAIQELRIPRGRGKELYRPDFLLVCNKYPRWLVEAKATNESIEDYTHQSAGYSLLINRKYASRPCRFYILTNGLLTRVYAWDQEEAILSLRFGDFAEGNTKYQTLQNLLNAEQARNGWTEETKADSGHLLVRPTMDIVKKAFLRCHRIIWKSEKMSPQAAFVEFAKLLFVKLWEDRRLRDDPVLLAMIGKGEALPASKVRFSTKWVEEQESNTPNPVDTLLFKQLVDAIEHEIAQRRRKRIFDPSERLLLSPGTAKRVVQELEGYYLFGIDEDLNGRMFEAFLAATMRGQALGQYFTPRSIAKMVTRLAGIKVGRGDGGVERVLDACCGTGGFLIEALTEMRQQVWNNKSLTAAERTRLLDEVANHAIFGIDAGRDPGLARIARINMYLHGDGGSRVYMTDALRDPPQASAADSVEVKEEVKELRRLLDSGTRFDVVLSNPPFSMDYSDSVPEEREVLSRYDLLTHGNKRRRALRSSVMFIERYLKLLKPGGRLLTVIDDSVLSVKNFAYVRSFIREQFVIRAIISLHGDSFQRAGARVKTSVLYLVKKVDASDVQSDLFVYESRYIGVDDVAPRTRPSVAESARKLADGEMKEILAAFNDYMNGKEGPWLVPSGRITDRLDAKHLRPWSVKELESEWGSVGATSAILEDLVECIDEPVELKPEHTYTFLRVSYDGKAERGDRALGREVSYKKIGKPAVGDIVVSNISAVYRAICVIPNGMDDVLVSSEFTVLRLKKGVRADPMYLWSVLRSTAVVAEWISGSWGMVGRHRVDWERLRQQRVPMLPLAQQRSIGDLYRKSLRYEANAKKCVDDAVAALSSLGLDAQAARDRLVTAKPPK